MIVVVVEGGLWIELVIPSYNSCCWWSVQGDWAGDTDFGLGSHCGRYLSIHLRDLIETLIVWARLRLPIIDHFLAIFHFELLLNELLQCWVVHVKVQRNLPISCLWVLNHFGWVTIVILATCVIIVIIVTIAWTRIISIAILNRCCLMLISLLWTAASLGSWPRVFYSFCCRGHNLFSY